MWDRAPESESGVQKKLQADLEHQDDSERPRSNSGRSVTRRIMSGSRRKHATQQRERKERNHTVALKDVKAGLAMMYEGITKQENQKVTQT